MGLTQQHRPRGLDEPAAKDCFLSLLFLSSIGMLQGRWGNKKERRGLFLMLKTL